LTRIYFVPCVFDVEEHGDERHEHSNALFDVDERR
jgi:hypothetical protein